jgi:FkbM family methyltransferase
MSLVRRALRRAAMAPLQLIDAQSRAEALEALSGNAVANTPITGGSLTFVATTPLLRSRAENALAKEPDTIEWLDGLTKDDVLWDVGANVGVFSLYAAARRHCTVLAFEPSAANFFVLSRNIQLNHLSERVTSYCVALSGSTGLGVLNLDSAALGTAMSQFGKPGETSRYSASTHPLTHGMVGFTIDEFIERFGARSPTHLKLDVDGLEWPILQGARTTLSGRGVRSAMIELSVTDREERQQAIEWLGECGLRLVGEGAAQGIAGEQAANHLFSRA